MMTTSIHYVKNAIYCAKHAMVVRVMIVYRAKLYKKELLTGKFANVQMVSYNIYNFKKF